VLAAAWARHRKLFAALRGVDPTITWLNLAYLGVVAFVPAGTPGTPACWTRATARGGSRR
jgi:uncharacterized membrane protein